MRKDTIWRILASKHWDAFFIGYLGSIIIFVLIWNILKWFNIEMINFLLNFVITLFIASFIGPIFMYYMYYMLGILFYFFLKVKIKERYISPLLILGAMIILIPIINVYKLSLIEIFILFGWIFCGSFLSYQILKIINK